MRIFAEAAGFEWDAGNREKSLKKHGVSNTECEEVFADERRAVREDVKHSAEEKRHYLIGTTKRGRLLFISYTIRNTMIRVISARDINKKERKLYE
jgi:uncharacterized protein